MESLPESIGNLIHLIRLSVIDQPLQTLPDSISNLRDLRDLSLRGNKLQSIPDSMGNLHQLQSLYLDGNNLQTIPESIGNLQNLKTLTLSNNQLTTLPQTLSNLTQLRLYVNNNPHLSSLPPGLRLQHLAISGCTSLTSLPDDIILESLELANSVLTSLPATLAQTKLLWRGGSVDVRHIFHPETITAQEVVSEADPQRRRALLDRLGYAAFFAGVDAKVLDQEQDGEEIRRLLWYKFGREETVVCLQRIAPIRSVVCTSSIRYKDLPGGNCMAVRSKIQKGYLISVKAYPNV